MITFNAYYDLKELYFYFPYPNQTLDCRYWKDNAIDYGV